MGMLSRIDVSLIEPGVVFSEPVFFDDGENMFLPANKAAKQFHLDVIKRWNVPFLLTEGKIIQKINEENTVN